MQKKTTFHRTLRFTLLCVALLIIVPLIFLLIYNYYFSVNIIYDQVAKTNKNMISLYMNQIDTALNEVDKHLVRKFLINDNYNGKLKTTLTSDDYVLTKIELHNEMKKDIVVYKIIDSFFIYFYDKDDLVEVFNTEISTREKKDVGNFIRKIEPDTQNWFVKKISNDYYIFKIFKIGNAYVGAWSKFANLLTPLELIDLGEKGISLFITDDGIPMSNQEIIESHEIELIPDKEDYYFSGEIESFLVISEKSAVGNFYFTVLIPEEFILADMPYIKNIIVIIVIVSILSLPVGVLLLNYFVLSPLNNILAVMKKIRKEGDMQSRIENDPYIYEFQVINGAFNKMMDRIQILKIKIYEEKLSKQKEELKHLKLQINPHFFLNSLNIIYSLAQTAEYEKIQTMTSYLMNYFRYMFSSNKDFVSLDEEIRFVENYIGIQKFRFLGKLDYAIKVENSLMDIPVPPIVIQTFVENSIKHGFTFDTNLFIDINIRESEDYQGCIEIIVRDNGTGFPEDILDRLSKGDKLSKGRQCIGIWNVKRRLELLYLENARLEFYNQSGALVKIILPEEP